MSKKNKNNVTLYIVLALVAVLVIVIFVLVRCNGNSEPLPSDISSVNPGTNTEQADSTNVPIRPDDLVDKNANAKLPDTFVPKENRQIAPDFTLPDLNGKNISLSDFQGQFLLLDFTTTWCGWCERQKPSLLELMEQNPDDFSVLAIDCRESKADVEAHYPNGPEYPLVLDETGQITSSYGVSGFPFYLLLSPTGEVIYYQSGYKEDMTSRVNAVLNEVRKNG